MGTDYTWVPFVGWVHIWNTPDDPKPPEGLTGALGQKYPARNGYDDFTNQQAAETYSLNGVKNQVLGALGSTSPGILVRRAHTLVTKGVGAVVGFGLNKLIAFFFGRII